MIMVYVLINVIATRNGYEQISKEYNISSILSFGASIKPLLFLLIGFALGIIIKQFVKIEGNRMVFYFLGIFTVVM
ncbi:hypothetical protein SAMN05216249_1098 [Acetitomaculum ruminis DSM 5522]|uniref:Uncharacterized protein n=2 Tax=Acetitomaculum ruminis TaxID=2382 RepID=A0A1I0Y9P8_9FIRM|nr:hypothetical protein SAMN05216249_1098 [Acetitomaculum ruminis DSM 5522]